MNWKIPKLWKDIELFRNCAFCSPKHYENAQVLEYLGFTAVRECSCPEDKIYLTDKNGSICGIIDLEEE